MTSTFSPLDSFHSLFSSGNIIEMTLKGIIIYLGLFWFALIIWVTRDIINRSNNVLLQTVAILVTALLPVFGLILYLLIRPSKTLLEKYYEELELKALSGDKNCPQCSASISSDFSFCPECGEIVKSDCLSCKKSSLIVYSICPYCGKDKQEEPKQKHSTKPIQEEKNIPKKNHTNKKEKHS